MSPKVLLSALLLAATILLPASASAHPRLKAANPAQSAVLTRSPAEIRMTFSEAVLPQFSGVQLTDQRGHIVATGKAMRNAADRKQLVVPLRVRLAAGTYRVSWRVVSADTHRIAGTYVFRVRN